MTDKPVQHSVTLAHNLRGYMNVKIDELLRTLEYRAGQLEQAFMAELAHLDELYTDQENDDTALELVQRFDKGYAKTMAPIQAATERLVEARAHITRIIEFHPAFTGNGCHGHEPSALPTYSVHQEITGTLDRAMVTMHGATPPHGAIGREGHTVEYNPLPTKETHHE